MKAAFVRAYAGAKWGIAFAAAYSAYALVVYIATGGAALRELHVTLLGVLVTYVIGGALAGAIVGIALPAARGSWIGAMLVGNLAIASVVTGGCVAMAGFPPWPPGYQFSFLVTTLPLGCYSGWLLRVRLLAQSRKHPLDSPSA